MKTYRSAFLFLILAMAFVSGCTITTFKDGKGVELSRTQFLNKQTIKKLRIGDAVLEGYSTDPNVEVANTIAQAVAAAVSDAIIKTQPAK